MALRPEPDVSVARIGGLADIADIPEGRGASRRGRQSCGELSCYAMGDDSAIGWGAAVGDALRGLSLWLGAALLGSMVTTGIADAVLGGRTLQDFHWIWIGLFALIFTVGGSAFLCLAFAWMGDRSFRVPARYGVLLVAGAAAGALILVPVGTPILLLAGLAYGLATALAWVTLHLILYKGR